jgi:succinoglycan biosynthesis transport protein ExoP
LPSKASGVLLCDANLRHPWLHRNLEINPAVGLSTLLAGLPDHGASVVPSRCTRYPGCFSSPPDHCRPTLRSCWPPIDGGFGEVVGIAIRSRALDAPPVLQVTDPVILSSMVNSVLLMAWHQKTPLPALEKSYRMLEEVHSANGRKINIVVNGVKEQSISYPESPTRGCRSLMKNLSRVAACSLRHYRRFDGAE